MRKKRMEMFSSLANILGDFGSNGDTTRAIRRLNIQAVNFSKADMKRQANLFKFMAKEIKIRG